MSRFIIAFLAVTGFIFSAMLIAPGVMAQEDGIVLESNFGEVAFDHSAHGDFSCEECHHVGETDQSFTDCHNEDADIDAKQAFHENCITCHQDQEAGPTGCSECHEK